MCQHGMRIDLLVGMCIWPDHVGMCIWPDHVGMCIWPDHVPAWEDNRPFGRDVYLA